MKQPHIKHTWIDDDNHPQKGYPVDELELVDETLWEIVVRRVKELLGKQ